MNSVAMRLPKRDCARLSSKQTSHVTGRFHRAAARREDISALIVDACDAEWRQQPAD